MGRWSLEFSPHAALHKHYGCAHWESDGDETTIAARKQNGKAQQVMTEKTLSVRPSFSSARMNMWEF